MPGLNVRIILILKVMRDEAFAAAFSPCSDLGQVLPVRLRHVCLPPERPCDSVCLGILILLTFAVRA